MSVKNHHIPIISFYDIKNNIIKIYGNSNYK